MRGSNFDITRFHPIGVAPSWGVNLIGLARPNDVVYRTFTIERFLEVLQKRELTLVKPFMWDDPFENVLRNAEVPINRKFSIKLHIHYDEFFGQCWCSGKETDASWRLYTPGAERGVRVRSSIDALACALCNAGAGIKANSLYIGQVQYLPVRQIKQLLTHQEIAYDIQQKVLQARSGRGLGS